VIFFDFLEVLITITTLISILYYLFRTAYIQLFQNKINNKTLSNEEGNGLFGVWGKNTFSDENIISNSDLDVLLALLYYFGAI
tara:strand:- start:2422 stop:2670 length:249 start_codon:yes stop_codon:yes gene_type:complete